MTLRRYAALFVLVVYCLYGVWTFVMSRNAASITVFFFVSGLLWFLLRVAASRPAVSPPDDHETDGSK